MRPGCGCRRPRFNRTSATQSSGWGAAPPALIADDYTSTFTARLLAKDLDLALALGEELGVPMWVSQAVRLVLKHGVFQGRAQQDLSRIVEIIEDGTRK